MTTTKRKKSGNMKLLIIGCGGIGSFLIKEICECMEQEQIDPNTEITIADNDIVELDQIKFQNFTFSEAGINKAKALATRFRNCGVGAITDRILRPKQLEGFSFIILCVDNDYTRIMVEHHCFMNNIEFIDLRASGRVVSAFPKLESQEENLKFTDPRDLNDYSCQDSEKLKRGMIDKGNKIVALIGTQMFLNHIRGMTKKAISLSI